jgi:hypothetical protein
VKKKLFLPVLLSVLLSGVVLNTQAQCSVCTKTASQMGEKPAKGMNAGILYLMAAPFAIVGYIGYRWWKSNGQ